MSASALLTLDTTPPLVEFGDSLRAGIGMRVPFVVDEPAIFVAEAEAVGIGSANVTIDVEDNEIVISGIPEGAEEITLTVTATDDVDNSSVTVVTLPVLLLDFVFPLMLHIDPTVERTLEIQINDRLIALDPAERMLAVEDAVRNMAVDETLARHLSVNETDIRSLSVEADERNLAVEDNQRNLNIEES